PAATLNNANIANPVATPAANTVYYVTVTGTNSCKNRDSINILIKALPVFSISANVSTCINGNAQLGASGGNSYAWSPANLLNDALIANPVATAIPSNTLFTVVIRDNVCNLQQTLSTTVRTDLTPPVINATKSNDIDCVFPASQLNVSGADTYSWSPATGLSGTTVSNPLAQPVISTQYTVAGVNAFTKCTSTDTITVIVKAPAAPAAYIPNTFTPNGDGTNDCFRVRDFGTVKIVDIIIYNRYGNLVFKTKKPTECWDGTYKGQPADVGNYVYYIKVLNDCGEEVQKGNLLLLR
ncbi:MAG TPA: gliding motility-associated C-terminal domain-containing protein, partial [Ferruginibacter sp.]|nr:gliding motility-associated C-terminal domain-containing protein [Ferruginibacter sp.]